MAKTTVNPRITCSECGKVFKLKIKAVVRKEISSELETTFCKCSHCGKKYTITYEDKEFKDNLKNMSIIKNQMKEIDSKCELYNKLLVEYQEYHKKNIEISKRYKKIYDN